MESNNAPRPPTDIALVEPTDELRAEFLEMAAEYEAAGEARPRYRAALEDFDAFLRRVRDSAAGVNLPPDRVPETTLWLVRGRRPLGSSHLRHRLSDELAHEGGHIGYDIRPAERRKGYGTLILALTLGRARGRGLKSVMLTCDTDNVASARVIEKNGGRLTGRAVSRLTGKQISQYWIEL